MANLTGTQIQTAVHALGYDAIPEATMIAAINLAAQRIYGAYEWPFLVTAYSVPAVAGQGYLGEDVLSASGDGKIIEMIFLSFGDEDYDLEYVPFSELYRLQHIDDETGTPQYWTQYDSKVLFYPIPDKAYTVTARVRNATGQLTALASEVALSSRFLEALTQATVEFLAYRQRDWGAVSHAKDSYAEALRIVRAQYKLGQAQTSSQVKSGYWDRHRHGR